MQISSVQSKSQDSFNSINNQQKERKICIEKVCLQKTRLILSENQLHQNHQIITQTNFNGQIDVLKCNYHFRQTEQDKVLKIILQLQSLYDQIVRFEHEIIKKFNELKTQVNNHIKQVKRSFSQDYYNTIKTKTAKQFTYMNVSTALEEVKQYKLLKYPNLDYPNYKIDLLQTKLSSINLNNKAIALEAVSSWIQRLLGQDYNDHLKSFSNSLSSFMFKSPSQKSIFSYYLKNPQYSLSQNGLLLKRIGNTQQLPVAVVEKELHNNVEVKFRIIRLGRGMVIGFADLAQLQANQFNNSLNNYKSAQFINHRGDHLICMEKSQNLKLSQLSFSEGDIVCLKRIQGTIQFTRKRRDKSESVRVQIKNEHQQHHLYPCIILMDQQAIILLSQ